MPDEPTSAPDPNLVAALKAAIQPDIEALKSSFNSTIDKTRSGLLDEILPLVDKDGSPRTTELGKKRDELQSQREQQRLAEEAAAKIAARDEYWTAYNEAVYENQFPKEAFEGLTSAADIRRQTAVLRMFKPADQTNTKPGGTGRAGAGSPGAADPTAGMDSAERTHHAINKSFPMQPGQQWSSTA